MEARYAQGASTRENASYMQAENRDGRVKKGVTENRISRLPRERVSLNGEVREKKKKEKPFSSLFRRKRLVYATPATLPATLFPSLIPVLLPSALVHKSFAPCKAPQLRNSHRASWEGRVSAKGRDAPAQSEPWEASCNVRALSLS